MNLKYAIAALLLASSASTAMAATTGSQKFKVTVPSSISIIAPENVSLTHSETENNPNFGDQSWTVKGNTLAGVNVSLVAGSPFQHTTDTGSKRNASLGLTFGTLTGPTATVWTLTSGSDATDYAAATPKNTATVQATSNGVGTAELKLSVTFVTDGFGTFAAGTYETTVTGTVASN